MSFNKRCPKAPVSDPLPTAENDGFTLIEIICSLILVGILAGLTLGFLTKGFTGYAETRLTGRNTAQVELGLLRLQRALYGLGSVTFANSGALTFIDNTNQQTALSRNAANQLLLNGSPLMDDVESLTLGYTATDGKAWTTSQSADTLALVTITLTLSQTADRAISLTVCPRSNGNEGIPAD